MEDSTKQEKGCEQELLLSAACEALGWQGGTIHQVLDVLRASKWVVDTYERHNYVDDLGLLPKSIASLAAHINGSRFST